MGEVNAVGFTIFDIPAYFFFTGIGLVISISIFIILMANRNYSPTTNIRILFAVTIIVILSARLFGCLSGIYRDIGLNREITWDSIKQTGIVFYGGLIGLLMSYRLLTRLLKQDYYILDILAVCIPLFHSISRVGCFFGGCCFGKESNTGFAVNYTTRVFDEIVTANRIPVQLIEAVFNACLFFYLYHLLRNSDWTQKNILRRYLLLYSIGRFLIEFLRGDLTRGVIAGISFSQIISVLIWVYLFITAYNKYKKPKMEEMVL